MVIPIDKQYDKLIIISIKSSNMLLVFISLNINLYVSFGSIAICRQSIKA